LPFYWRDTFPAEGQIRRLYMGGLRPHAPVLGNEQPVPLYNVREAFTAGAPIGHRLQPLFARFRVVRDQYNLNFVLSPLWTALDGNVDDKLAEACVSLERLSTAHADFERSSERGRPRVEMLTRPQATELREALVAAAREVARTALIPADVLRIIENKIANIHQPPNADKLEVVFAHVGIRLREDEEDAIHNRNRALHGRATLGGHDLAAIAAELHRFDILRTLIHKAVLRLLDYTGPYMDYGDHPEGTAYTIKELRLPAPGASGSRPP
jgi:hypothetical protein